MNNYQSDIEILDTKIQLQEQMIHQEFDRSNDLCKIIQNMIENEGIEMLDEYQSKIVLSILHYAKSSALDGFSEEVKDILSISDNDEQRQFDLWLIEQTNKVYDFI